LNAFWILSGLFLFVFLAWLSLSIYVVLNRLWHERRSALLEKAMLQLGTSQPVMLTAKTRLELVYPLITRLPQPVVYRAAADVAVYKPVAEVFAVHALAQWGADVFTIASNARPGNDRWQRISALCILTRVKADCVHDLLFDALQDRDTDVASSAVVLLGRLKDMRAAERLVEALRLQLYLPSFIARQLDDFKIPLGDLLEPLLDARSAQVRYWAVILLGRHGEGDKRLAQIVACMANDPDPAIRKAVAQTLGMLDASEQVLAVLQLLYDDTAFVRVHAVKALAHFNQPDFDGSITALLDDPDWRVRQAAREALASKERAAMLGVSSRFWTAGKVPVPDLEKMDSLRNYVFENIGHTLHMPSGLQPWRL
jgi:HEAT repeat protein